MCHEPFGVISFTELCSHLNIRILIVSSQARSYIASMPDFVKKPFSEFFLNANPNGK